MRVIVDIRVGHMPTVYVERFADRQVLDIMAVLAGDTDRIRVDREQHAEPRRTFFAGDAGDWSISVRAGEPGIVRVWCGNAQTDEAEPLTPHAARQMAEHLIQAAKVAEGTAWVS